MLRNRNAVSLIEIVILTCIVVLLGAVLLLYLQSNRRLSYVTRCANTMKGIGLGFASYSAGSIEEWPLSAHSPGIVPGVGRTTYAPGKIGIHRERDTTLQDTEVSMTRSFWVLVRSGNVPANFICPTSNDQPDWPGISETDVIDEKLRQQFWDFSGYNHISYGLQVSFGKEGRMSPNVYPDMALVADKGPYSAALEAGKPNPGVPTVSSEDSPGKWMPWNSPNHQGRGQNAMYNDGHVEFFSTPLAGCDKDNIYTQWGTQNSRLVDLIHGKPPTGIETPMGQTDSLIYP